MMNFIACILHEWGGLDIWLGLGTNDYGYFSGPTILCTLSSFIPSVHPWSLFPSAPFLLGPFSFYTSYWLHAVQSTLHFPSSRPCSKHFPPMLSIGSYYKPNSPILILLIPSLCQSPLSIHHTLQPWRWKQHGPPKCWYPTTKLHGAKTQKTTNSVLMHVQKYLADSNEIQYWSSTLEVGSV
jgi:hypothetical protein